MKQYVFSFLILVSIFLVSCSKSGEELSYVDVIYEVNMEPSTSNEPFYIKGHYYDEKGLMKKIDVQAPWKLTLKNIPYNQKIGFEGYLYCLATHRLKGKISMQVVTPRGKRIYYDQHEMDYSYYQIGSLGFSGQELKDESSFYFERN